MKRSTSILYLAVILLICLVPSLGLLFFGSGEEENASVSARPVLVDEEKGLNVRYLQDAGDYFEDHFALRSHMVTGYALLGGKCFGTSTQDQVVAGSDGWLYYADSLDDYQGTHRMSERNIFDAAHSMALLQEQLKKQGIRFLFVFCANKNTLYPEHMPYYYMAKQGGDSNRTALMKAFDREGVNYVDMGAVFAGQEEVLYHMRDSHWNNKGAAIGADAIMDALNHPHPSYAERGFTVREDFEGDLDGMLYPEAVTPEAEIYYDPAPQFAYVTPVEDNYALQIETEGSADGAAGSLLMYRDSFGNALLPFMAEAYQNAFFARMNNVQMSDIAAHAPDTVILEKVERFLPLLANYVPQIVSPDAPLCGPDKICKDFSYPVEEMRSVPMGEYTKLTGVLPEGSYARDSRLVLQVNGDKGWEAFTYEDALTHREMWQVIVPSSALPDGYSVGLCMF